MIPEFPLLTRRWHAGRLDETIAALNTAELAIEYRRFREVAPQRGVRDRKYFVGHTGSTPGGSASNRREEHLARALCNEGAPLPWRSNGSVRLLDYQVPLKARRNNAGIGKLDLLGVTEAGRLVVIELKVDGAKGGRSDPPPAALMEALRYAAIVEANHAIIAKEAKAEFKVNVSDNLPPAILLLGTNAWWQAWLKARSAGSWTAGFRRLLNDIECEFCIPVKCLEITENVLDASSGRQFAPVVLA
jgi:hypothetical protein